MQDLKGFKPLSFLPRDYNLFCVPTLYHIFVRSARFDWLRTQPTMGSVSNFFCFQFDAVQALDRFVLTLLQFLELILISTDLTLLFLAKYTGTQSTPCVGARAAGT